MPVRKDFICQDIELINLVLIVLELVGLIWQLLRMELLL